jgi:hypothetical protein
MQKKYQNTEESARERREERRGFGCDADSRHALVDAHQSACAFFEDVSLERRADFLADARDDAKRQIRCAFSEKHRRTRPRDGEMEF